MLNEGTVPSEPARRERGSVLLLFPAAVMIMVVMAALAIDVSYTQVTARELGAVAASAANDAIGALDVDELRAGQGLVIDPSEARRIVAAAVAAGPHPDATIVAIDVTTDGTGDAEEIAVTLRLEVELVMAPALGDLDRVTLIRTGRAVILRGRA